MKTYTHLADFPTPHTPVVATIGNFDGVHLGHQGVITEVIERARFLGGQSLVITFDPHPARVLRPETPFQLLTPLHRRLELLAATGVDATLVLPFTDELRHMHPRDFVTGILVNTLHVTEIHEGENFRFGYHAEAGVHGLEALGREFGFTVIVYAPRIVRGAAVSSSRIRKLLTDTGDVSHARALLGRPFSIDSNPAPGRGYGKTYAVPTINLAPYPELLPAHGVYITTLTVGGYPEAGSPMLEHGISSRLSGSGNRYPEASASGLSGPKEMKGLQPLGQTFDAVTNIGNRPTFGIDSFAVESHLLNFHPLDLTGQTPLRLTFLRRLRAERRFASTQELRDQIARDVAHAQRYFDLCRLLR